MRTKWQRCGRRFWGFCGVPLSILATLGCEAQAGNEYTGEPIFSLQGQVVLSEPGVGVLVPALGFLGKENILMDVEVRGDFPASFRLDVMQPPPESAFLPKEWHPDVKGRMAMAFIVVAPPDYPRSAPLRTGVASSECNEDGTNCIVQEEECTSDGRCRQRTLECVVDECPLLSSTAPDAEGFAFASNLVECATGACMTVAEFCRAGNNCEREIRKCDRKNETALTKISSDGTYETCVVTAESGDTTLSVYESAQYVRGFFVIYLTEPNELRDVGRLERGYNLIEEVQPSDEDWIARIDCEHDAIIAAVDEYNETHGTSYTAHEGYDRENGEFYGGYWDAAEPIDAEAERLRALCPIAGGPQVVRSPLERELTLRVGKTPDRDL